MKSLVISAICLAFVSGPADQTPATRAFPEWRGSNVLVSGLWAASPIVAIGDVVNVSSYGEQSVEILPWPMSTNVHKLYWCSGEFRAVAVVKGVLHSPSKRFLWASAQSGCLLSYLPTGLVSRFETRVWFLREEGESLRPTFDGGTNRFLGLFAKWDSSAPEPARRLGKLLLTPSANSVSLTEYGHYLWQVGDIACELLGHTECVRQIRGLVLMGNDSLVQDACNFLKAQLAEPCSAN